MSYDLHPYRFYAAGNAAAGREDVVKGSTPPQEIPEPVRERMKVIRHVRDLILDWAEGGEVMFDMESLLEEYAGVESIEVEGGPKIMLPAPVFYVHFGEKAGMRLEEGDAFIDGMYVQETAIDGKIGMEFTYVCNEPAWDGFDTIGENKLLNTAGRVVRAFSPYGGRIERGMRQTGYLGCVDMMNDSAFELAIQRTLLCLKNICDPENAPAPEPRRAMR